MEKYFPSVRPGNVKRKPKRYEHSYKPYARPDIDVDCKSVKKEAMSLVLNNLSDPANPLTHSDIRERTDHVVSASTGHQVSDGKPLGKTKEYLHDRSLKLKAQQEQSSTTTETPQVMRNVHAYINGFLEDTTDIEIKRVITEAGGMISMVPSARTTHVITSMKLSGTKTHKLLTKKQHNSIAVVKPAWVFDSIAAKKRQAERQYSILSSSNEATRNLADMLREGRT